MTTLAVLNPWQAPFAALLASIKPDRDFFILEWNPQPGQAYIRLGQLSSLIEEGQKDLSRYLPSSLPALLGELDPARDAANLDFLEVANFALHVRPSSVLVMADILPTDSFWKALPADALIGIRNVTSEREEILEQQKQVIRSLEGRTPSTQFAEDPLELLACVWQFLHTRPLDWSRGILLAGTQPPELLTGLYFALKENVPLVPSQIVGGTTANVAMMSFKDKDKPGSLLKSYPITRRASSAARPAFQCVLEEESSVAFVLALKRCFDKGGELILSPGPSEAAIHDARAIIHRIARLASSGSERALLSIETRVLRDLVTGETPAEVRAAVAENPEVPVEVIGRPFPYGLCSEWDAEICWAETQKLSFLPQAAVSQLLQRDFIAPVSKNSSENRAPLCLVVDALPGSMSTEARSVTDLLENVGAYTLVAQGGEATVKLVCALLELLPVELVIFIAHGTKDTLELVDGALTTRLGNYTTD